MTRCSGLNRTGRKSSMEDLAGGPDAQTSRDSTWRAGNTEEAE